MSFKKNLEPEDVSISSFQVHKTFTFTDADSGSGVYGFSVAKGTDSTLHNFDADTAVSKSFGTGSADSPKTRTFYSTPTYEILNALYYRDINQMQGGIDFVRGVPTGSSAIVTYSHTNKRAFSHPTFSLDLRRPHTRQLKNTATVISIPQKFYGEYINPFSVTVTDDSTDNTYVLKDDGRGNLYDVTYSSSYANRTPDSKNSGSLVGNVFYRDGVVVITDTGSYSTVGTGNGSDGFIIKFDAAQTIYEREYVCVANENEYEHTSNRSLKVGFSGSATIGSGSYQKFAADGRAVGIVGSKYDTFPYDIYGHSTSSYNTDGYKMGTELIGVATHSEFSTYVTSIGLYNDQNELLAIGKTAKPIKNEKELSLSFVVRFDTN